MSSYRVKQWSPQGLFLEICLQAPALEWKSKNWWHSLHQKCLLYHRKQVKCWATKSQVTSNQGPRKKKNRKLQLILLLVSFTQAKRHIQPELILVSTATRSITTAPWYRWIVREGDWNAGGGDLVHSKVPPHQHLIHRYPFILLDRERHWELKCLALENNTNLDLWPRLQHNNPKVTAFNWWEILLP